MSGVEVQENAGAVLPPQVDAEVVTVNGVPVSHKPDPEPSVEPLELPEPEVLSEASPALVTTDDEHDPAAERQEEPRKDVVADDSDSSGADGAVGSDSEEDDEQVARQDSYNANSIAGVQSLLHNLPKLQNNSRGVHMPIRMKRTSSLTAFENIPKDKKVLLHDKDAKAFQKDFQIAKQQLNSGMDPHLVIGGLSVGSIFLFYLFSLFLALFHGYDIYHHFVHVSCLCLSYLHPSVLSHTRSLTSTNTNQTG